MKLFKRQYQEDVPYNKWCLKYWIYSTDILVGIFIPNTPLNCCMNVFEFGTFIMKCRVSSYEAKKSVVL